MGARSPKGAVTVTSANWFTLFRIVVIPFFWIFFFSRSFGIPIIATVLFILGAISDLIDGKLARRSGQETPFGSFMDPFADKLLVLSAFWAILIREDFSSYLIPVVILTAIITLRETLFTVLRIWSIEGRSSLSTNIWGKWKTGIQLTSVILAMVLFNLREMLTHYGKPIALLESDQFSLFLVFLFFVCMIASVSSGIIYYKGRLPGYGKSRDKKLP